MKPRHKGEKNPLTFYKDSRTEAEKILDGMQQKKEELELIEMNGTRCGGKQIKSLRYYYRAQRSNAEKKD